MKNVGWTRLSISLSSSAAACPETCTCVLPLWMTFAPALASRLMTRLTAFSLPGTGVAAMITVSPRSMVTVLWSPLAMRASAESGSPWLPVHMTTTFSGASPWASKASTMFSSCDLQVAELAGDLGVGDHRAAGDDDLAAGGDCGIAYLLDAVDVARERRHDHALLGVLDDVAQRRSDCGLGARHAGGLGVGGVRHQQVDADLAELRRARRSRSGGRRWASGRA